MQWLRRSLIAGFVVIVPLVISVAAFVWLFQLIDGVMGPVYARWIGREIPGFGLATLLVLVVAVGCSRPTCSEADCFVAVKPI